MASNDPFGFDPDDLNRFFPGAGEQLRGALGQFARMMNAANERTGGGFDGPGGSRRGRRPPRRPGTPVRACG